MERCSFVCAVAVAVLTASFPATAQQAGKVHRVALVVTTTPIAEMAGPDPVHLITRAFVHELRALGYVEGRNVIVERRSAEGKPERYPDIIAELVRLKTDVIAAGGSAVVVQQLKERASNIPIVMIGVNEPVKLGLVASLARPGGNITGITSASGPENEPKRLQLLKEVIPRLSRVGYLATKQEWDLPNAQAIRRAAPSLGMELLHAEHNSADIDATLAALARQFGTANCSSGRLYGIGTSSPVTRSIGASSSSNTSS